jgi:hypothetical protein
MNLIKAEGLIKYSTGHRPVLIIPGKTGALKGQLKPGKD